MKELMVCVSSSDSNGNRKSLVKKMKYYLTAKQFITPLGIMLFLSVVQGAKYLFFVSSSSLKTREKYISYAQFVYFSLVLRELEETKTKYAAP